MLIKNENQNICAPAVKGLKRWNMFIILSENGWVPYIYVKSSEPALQSEMYIRANKHVHNIYTASH